MSKFPASFTAEESDIAQASEIATRRGCSNSDIYREALREYLRNHAISPAKKQNG